MFLQNQNKTFGMGRRAEVQSKFSSLFHIIHTIHNHTSDLQNKVFWIGKRIFNRQRILGFSWWREYFEELLSLFDNIGKKFKEK